MHYYSHHIGDLIRDTANLDDHQLATYMRMIWAYYQSEQPLENNLEDIAFAMRSDEKTVRLLLRHYFKLEGDVWRHSRCDKEISNYHSKSEKASKSAKTRWTKPDLVLTDSEGNANALEKDANASKSDANQEPRTKNQEPIKKEKKAQALVVLFELPDWIDKNLWDTWHRTSKRKNANAEQKQIAVNKLSKWRDAGLDHAKALEDAAEGGWQGLHEPKQPITAKQPAEPAWRREQRERTANAVPGIAAKSIYDKQFIEMETFDVTAAYLD
jgi:uncharacterized protein YdaU (DUF1376 family)